MLAPLNALSTNGKQVGAANPLSLLCNEMLFLTFLCYACNFNGSATRDEWEPRIVHTLTDSTYMTTYSISLLRGTFHRWKWFVLNPLSLWYVKIKPSLCFNWTLRHEGVLGEWGIVPCILDLGTRRRWLTSRPGRFTPRERAPGTHWIGGWVGRRAGLDAVVKRKIPSPCRDSNPRSSSP
jgi:hypothetical protein